MGRKIPFEQAMKMKSVIPKETDPIFINPAKPNRYGYKINVNHPRIRPLFAAFHKHIGVPESVPLTNAQRFQFEAMVMEMIRRKEKGYVQPSDPDGQTDP